jgi:subtilase family serine protease
VLDGILDLISDFNSVEQSFFLIQWLKKITKIHNLLILCVLHLGKKDQNSIGHIGSYLDRKAQSVLKIEKNKENKTIDLSATFLRSSDEFNPISIAYTGSSWNQVNTANEKTGTYIFGMEKTSLINRILFQPRKYSEMLSDLEEFTGKGSTTCKKILKDWINDGSILKIGELYKQK